MKKINYNKEIIFVDMDDCICDFTGNYNHKLKLTPEIKYPQSQYGFFTDLKPIEAAIDAVNILRYKYDVYILTRPSFRNPLCYTEKRIWLEKYFGLPFCEKLILCGYKHLLKGDYLIDDHPWPLFEGEQILFGKEPFEDWVKVLNYFRNK